MGTDEPPRPRPSFVGVVRGARWGPTGSRAHRGAGTARQAVPTWPRVEPCRTPAYRRAVGAGPPDRGHIEDGEDEEDVVDAVIDARGLVKRYGDVVALDGLDLQVPRGTVLGLLGPNGAGKTTAVRILTTLLVPDAGEATIAGVDLHTDPEGVRRAIGLSGQYAAVDEYLTGFENLDMIGRLYRLGRRRARQRARELLEIFDLAEAGDRPVKGYSGGMRRRLDLAGALVAEPEVLFLDEPTTGLDPRSRTDMWDVIRELVGHGTTLLLTTQYLEEADRLADEIVVIDHGRAIARGTADQLKAQVGGERLELVVEHEDRLADARRVLEQIAVGEVLVDEHTRQLTAPCAGGAGVLMAALRSLDAEGIEILDVGLRRPTLDDVFLTLTGHVAEQEVGESEPGPADGAGSDDGPGVPPVAGGVPSSDGHRERKVRR
jgi:ABC-2 type transport system ATP-binding protein